ncbi:MAG TPA: cation diffusion facilitator family transporter [Hanamia sp.]|jgi:cobalt-zinc-cadmium efflux system protein|nr:cation diffusion facilitator family transporter [Hanamia sp.]
MEHNHSHHAHDHFEKLTNVNAALLIGIVLNSLFVVVEAVIGFSIDSLSLLSDAGHNLADVGSLALSLLAFRMLKIKPNNKYTYGYRKTTILASLVNGVILLISVGAIVYAAIQRFSNPPALPGKTIALVAGIGIIINFVTAFMFLKNKDSDLNIKGAYLHMLADGLVSVGIMAGGIIIYFTQLYWIDPVFSLIIVIVILSSTWSLLKESLALTLDAVPKDISVEEIKKNAEDLDGIKNLHHIHIWAMSTTENAMTAHMVIDQCDNVSRIKEIKNKLKHRLEHMNIQHITLETEFSNDDCLKKECAK